MDIQPKINWFPGHMKRASDEIARQIKNVDLLIEVLDARCIQATENPTLSRFNKSILRVALKEDLALPEEPPLPDVLVGSIKQTGFRAKIIQAMDEVLAQKITRLRAKSLKNPKFLVMVVGLPNVGKSSLINFLKQKRQLVAENRPGVTKHQAIVNINDRYALVDTPGVLFKNIPTQTQAFNLVLIQCIRKDVVQLGPVLEYAFAHLGAEFLAKFYEIAVPNNFHTFINALCQKFQFYQPGSQLDTERGMNFFFQDIVSGRIGRLNWDNFGSQKAGE